HRNDVEPTRGVVRYQDLVARLGHQQAACRALDPVLAPMFTIADGKVLTVVRVDQERAVHMDVAVERVRRLLQQRVQVPGVAVGPASGLLLDAVVRLSMVHDSLTHCSARSSSWSAGRMPALDP